MHDARHAKDGFADVVEPVMAQDCEHALPRERLPHELDDIDDTARESWPLHRLERSDVTSDDLVIRTMHDVGLAAWFGGGLMGAIGLNGAANDIADSSERPRIAAAGWARWAPVNAVAIGVHLVGGSLLTARNRQRVITHRGSRWNTAAKTAITGAALGATAYSGWQGRTVAQHGRAPAAGGAVPGSQTPDDVAAAQQRLRLVQWVIPALTGALVVLGAQQGEQQRPKKLAKDIANRTRRRVTS